MSMNKSFTGSLNKKKTVLFVPYNGKIADITHADTNNHTLDLAAALSETRKIIAVECEGRRIAGTGYFKPYPNEGSGSIAGGAGSYSSWWCIIKPDTNRLQYSLSVANDDWDLYCWGYTVES